LQQISYGIQGAPFTEFRHFTGGSRSKRMTFGFG